MSFSAAVPGNPSDILSQTSEAAAGAQPIEPSHLHPHKSGGGPPHHSHHHFAIVSRFVFFTPALDGGAAGERRRVQTFVHAYLAARFVGVSVTFGNAETMHVAYGGPREVWWPSAGDGADGGDGGDGGSSGGIPGWPKQAGIGPEIPPGGFKTGSGSGLPRIGGPGGPIDGLNPGPVVVGGSGNGGESEDPVKPIEDALLAAQRDGLLPEGENWTFGPVIRE